VTNWRTNLGDLKRQGQAKNAELMLKTPSFALSKKHEA